MNYAYIRQMQDGNSMSKQQRNILSFTLACRLDIEKEVIEYSNKNHSIEERKEFEKFMHSLEEGSTLIVDNISILSDRAEELIKIINCMLSRKIDLYIASAKTLINKEAKATDIFPLLNDLREAQKEKSNQIGRPKGSRSSSKFDVYQTQIISFLKKGMNVSAIARELNVSRSSLKDYIESRNIRDLVEESWLEINPSKVILNKDNTVLVCPFEQEKAEEAS